MRIKLTGFVDVEELTGKPGDEVDVTDDNRSLCELLLKNGGARKLAQTAAITRPENEEDDDDHEDDDLLTVNSPVTDLAKLGIHGRYVAALKEAGATTLGDVKSAGDDIAGISGISPDAAKKIKEVLAQEID